MVHLSSAIAADPISKHPSEPALQCAAFANVCSNFKVILSHLIYLGRQSTALPRPYSQQEARIDGSCVQNECFAPGIDGDRIQPICNGFFYSSSHCFSFLLRLGCSFAEAFAASNKNKDQGALTGSLYHPLCLPQKIFTQRPVEGPVPNKTG